MIEFALHRELSDEQNIALAREFVQDQICVHGMAAQMNFHFDVDGDTGEEKPHCHVVIEMEPQPKMGRNVLELEKRLQAREGSHGPITERAKVFHETELRNLYRIVRNPDVVLDIVTKHHATFMWADVQKVIHRYVDEALLFQWLEAKLKNSSELILLRPGDNAQAIYTTRDMLKAERSLVERAESLDKTKSHGVDEYAIIKGIQNANNALGELSRDQVKAIYHLSDTGQIKCMVGIAGAGKTTALGVCQDIWKATGYNVYGLTPTGKAAQNLEESGIKSTTLHKFLKSYEEGRCQYNANSVLVLDEAGMVDVPRFGKLMNAVQQLGVKLVVVGDGAQLQPVEAGPAFRLVTERLGKSELNTVVRQKSEWQREATVLFGKQQTKEAIQAYVDKGFVKVIDEGEASDKREKTKETLVHAWHSSFKESPEKSTLILAHTNKDVNDLNTQVRVVLKESGHLSGQEYTYTIKKEVEDDFGKRNVRSEEKAFSQGDRIVFTRNNYGLGVKNGSLGTITELDKQNVHVTLDDGKDITFAPKLNPHFDQGWAITIHKSQGTTVDKTYVLASFEMTQNLAYVAMTRHRDDTHVYGSSHDFWKEEKLPEILSKSAEKLSAADYLDAESLNKLMEKEDKLLTKIFDRAANELEAMGVVAKKAFWQVADHFLGTRRDKEITAPSNSIREEVRANEALHQKPKVSDKLQSVFDEMKQPAFDNATVVKRAFEKGLQAYGQEQAIEYWDSKKEAYIHHHQQNLERVETELHSPLLNNLTDKWKDQARGFAQQDPLKVLGFLDKLKQSELDRRETRAAETRAAQEQQAKRDHINGIYQNYKELHHRVIDKPEDSHREDLKKCAHELMKDKTFMENLKVSDAKEAMRIEQLATNKKLLEQERIQEHIHSLNRDSGMSL